MTKFRACVDQLSELNRKIDEFGVYIGILEQVTKAEFESKGPEDTLKELTATLAATGTGDLTLGLETPVKDASQETPI